MILNYVFDNNDFSFEVDEKKHKKLLLENFADEYNMVIEPTELERLIDDYGLLERLYTAFDSSLYDELWELYKNEAFTAYEEERYERDHPYGARGLREKDFH